MSTTRSYPRTNALGSAKDDCHTCSRLGKRCDRQRPQCGPCIQEGHKCGGFAMKIKWTNEKASLPGRKRKVNTTTDLADDDDESDVQDAAPGRSNKRFRFAKNGTRHRRKTVKLPTPMDQFLMTISALPSPGHGRAETMDELATSPSGNLDDMPTPGEHDDILATSMESNWNIPAEDLLPTSGQSPSSSPTEPDDFRLGLPLCSDPSDANIDGFHWRDEESHLLLYEGAPAPAAPFSPIWFPLSPGPLYDSPTHKAAGILDMYDQEFCVLPLTGDCLNNPFRIRQDSCEGSAFLLHAMLAISSQHLAKKNQSAVLKAEMWNHQATALRLFSEALSYTPASELLDALLLLVNFEATQTAASTWSVHLSGAQKLLDSMGGTKVCERGPRARAQVAMLVWWDTTLAIISRKQPRFSSKYLKSLMKYDEEDGWTFFTLNGCPPELMLSMARLAELAATYEKVLDLEWATFNTYPVEEIIQQVQAWTNGEDATADTVALGDDDPECRRNNFHCIEAWRHAILLYAHRVFFRPQTAARLRSITHLARVVLDHIRCIPQTAIVQKQTLLPMFLAATEVGDEINRAFALSYCSHWSLTARYSMFGTVANLLVQIWADWDISKRDVYWWGVKVGNRSSESASGNEGLVSEILLG